MHFSLSAAVVAVAAFAPALAYTPADTKQSDAIASKAFTTLKAAVADGSLKTVMATRGVQQTCSIKNAAVRREYSTLSAQEKRDYTNSIKCMMAKPSKIAPGRAPGAKSRYDDFIAIHLNQTEMIHSTGNFLTWHRYYLWAFEQALRTECGYKGYIPYWNWIKSSKDMLNSPYFDGSELSQGGNGEWAPHSCTRRVPEAACITEVVQGRGGGCVKTGPYKDMIVNMTAVDLWFDNTGNGKGPKLGYNPRCLRRDISPEYAAKFQTEQNLVDLLTKNNDIGSFQDAFQGGINLHGVGHFAVGGDPGGDFFISPGDPNFWLHHSMVDRVWWMWQNQNPTTRSMVIAGNTIMMVPTSPLSQLTDLLHLEYVTPAGLPVGGSPIYQHVSSVAGPYCYVYLNKGSCKAPVRRGLEYM